MKTLHRMARGAAIALALSLVAAAGPVAASTPPAAVPRPIRTVNHQLTPFTIDAGQACAFDVEGQPSWGFSARTTFSDGRVLVSVRAHGAYVNVETGERYPTADNYRDISTTDANGVITGSESGETTWYFLPGEVGPFGVVQEPGALYHFVGSVRYTYDTVAGRATSFAFAGTVVDVCAALS